jgi:hypothetical protein
MRSINWKSGAVYGFALGILTFILSIDLLPVFLVGVGAWVTKPLIWMEPWLAVIPLALGVAALINFLQHALIYAILGAMLGSLYQQFKKKHPSVTLPMVGAVGASTLAVTSLILVGGTLALTKQGDTYYEWGQIKETLVNYDGPLGAWQPTNPKFLRIEPSKTVGPGTTIRVRALFYALPEGASDTYLLGAGMIDGDKPGKPILDVTVSGNECDAGEDWFAVKEVNLEQGYHWVFFDLLVPEEAEGSYDLAIAWLQDCYGTQPMHQLTILDQIQIEAAPEPPEPEPTTTTVPSPTTTLPSDQPIEGWECDHAGILEGEIIQCNAGQLTYRQRTCRSDREWGDWDTKVIDCTSYGYDRCIGDAFDVKDPIGTGCHVGEMPTGRVVQPTPEEKQEEAVCEQGQIYVLDRCVNTGAAGITVVMLLAFGFMVNQLRKQNAG